MSFKKKEKKEKNHFRFLDFGYLKYSPFRKNGFVFLQNGSFSGKVGFPNGRRPQQQPQQQQIGAWEYSFRSARRAKISENAPLLSKNDDLLFCSQ